MRLEEEEKKRKEVNYSIGFLEYISMKTVFTGRGSSSSIEEATRRRRGGSGQKKSRRRGQAKRGMYG